MEVTLVDATTGTVTNVSGTGKKGAWFVLDVSCDLVVAQFASLDTCPQLVIFAGLLEFTSEDNLLVKLTSFFVLVYWCLS